MYLHQQMKSTSSKVFELPTYSLTLWIYVRMATPKVISLKVFWQCVISENRTFDFWWCELFLFWAVRNLKFLFSFAKSLIFSLQRGKIQRYQQWLHVFLWLEKIAYQNGNTSLNFEINKNQGIYQKDRCFYLHMLFVTLDILFYFFAASVQNWRVAVVWRLKNRT